MNKKPLETLFEAMYHSKRSFDDFARGPVAQKYVRHRFCKQGKTREVLSPDDKLRAYHEFLRLFLLDFLPQNEEVVFSYRKGVSAYDAVSRHAQSKFFFVCDIADFFPSLKRHRIRQTILSGKDSSPVADLDQWLERILDLVSVDDCLPMGFSTSPTISNAALLPFDNAVQWYCASRGLIYTRYSDDMVVSAKEFASLDGIEETLGAFFVEYMDGDLALHPGKSKLLRTGSKIRLLGMVLLPNGTISVDASIKSEIEVLIHFYIKDRAKFADRADGDAQKVEARLAGLLNYANTVDQSYLQKLRKKFGAAVVDLFLHRSFG
ncbi:reverse transcriptase family protein [Cupriavidus necator]|uniref:reverse transcriptase family protein n=1 Tax=Cupriavidus necator TaxID=106590 RepID=UPI00059F9EB3|nr:reverse transcriptase family protein [Cupriavidus necator]QQB75803.1 RNA-directed DNA polymerase [Cupriavidus necator]WKA39755.1 reverse transcriptase family protein [Cupriavidus necator]